MIEQLQLILKALPWTLPAVFGGFVLAVLTMLIFPSRRSRSDRVGFALLTWCLVVAGVVTLSPVRTSYFGVPTLGCDWNVWKPLARDYWFSAGSRPPNVWLFFPAGVGVMLLDGLFRKIVGVAALFALPVGIEALQDLYPQLKRSCSSQDIADNWTGLTLGLALGLVLAVLIGIARLITRGVERRRERRAGVLDGVPASQHDDDVAPDEDATGEYVGGDEHVDVVDESGQADSRTRARTSDGEWVDDAPTQAARPAQRPRDPRTSGTSASGATRVIPVDRGPDATPPYGTYLGDHDTEIIPRS